MNEVNTPQPVQNIKYSFDEKYSIEEIQQISEEIEEYRESSLSHINPNILAAEFRASKVNKSYDSSLKKDPIVISTNSNQEEISIEIYKDGLLKTNKLEEQRSYLEKLGFFYLEKNEFVESAKYFNCSLALLKDSQDYSQLEKIEKKFLETKNFKLENYKTSIEHYRSWLRAIRDRCKQAIESQEEASEISSDLTENFKKIFRILIAHSIEILGTPPVVWSCIGMGSMARNEMCPYSDLEFAFLIEDDSKEEALEYFRTLTQFLEIRVINLGETDFSIIKPSPTPSGFCFDTGGNIPIGGSIELISTPAKLAQMITVKKEGNIILSNALTNVCFVTGNDELFHHYNREKEEFLRQKQSFFGDRNSQILAFSLLKGHLEEYSPNPSKLEEDISAFGIKQELYRPFQQILGSLSLFFELKGINTLANIDELEKLKVLSSQGAKNLKQAINKVLQLRIQAHLFYQNEKDYLCHSSKEIPEDPRLLYITEKYLNDLLEIYRVLIPFLKSVKVFFQSKEKKALNQEIFLDESPFLHAEELAKRGYIKEAQGIYQQEVSLFPENKNALLGLANTFSELGQHETALLYSVKIMNLLGKGDEKMLDHTAHLMINSLIELSRYREALEVAEGILKNYLNIFPPTHFFIAKAYSKMGSIYFNLGDYQKSLEYHEKDLKISQKKLNSENELTMAGIFNGIGAAHLGLRNIPEALENLKKALKIQKKFLSSVHPDLASTYNNMGTAFLYGGDFKKSLSKSLKALKIFSNIYPENHPSIALVYNNIGSSLDRLGKFEDAIENYKKSIKINSFLYGPKNLSIAVNYNQISIAFYQLGKYTEALNKLEKAFLLLCDIYQKENDRVLECLTSLIRLLNEHTQMQEIEKVIEKTVPMCIKTLGKEHPKTQELIHSGPQFVSYLENKIKNFLILYGENHIEVAKSYNILGKVLFNKKKYSDAEQCFQNTLKILIKLFGNIHMDVAECYRFIGNTKFYLKRYKEAFNYSKKAFLIACEAYSLDKSGTKIELIDCLKDLIKLMNKACFTKGIDNHEVSDDMMKNIHPVLLRVLGFSHELHSKFMQANTKLIMSNGLEDLL